MAQSPTAAPGIVAAISTGALPGALAEVGGAGTKRFALLTPQEINQTAGEAESNATRRPVLLKMQQAPLLPKVSRNVVIMYATACLCPAAFSQQQRICRFVVPYIAPESRI